MFLKPLLRNPERGWTLVNDETRAVLASRVHAAVDSATRRRGLLGRTGLDDEALIIAPCNAVHTFFMRFPIDIVYTDRHGVVERCVASVPPWRLSASLRGFATIELPAGTIARTGTRKGQRVEIRER